MKKFIHLAVLVALISSCGTQKTSPQLKKYKTKDFIVSYPNTWMKHVKFNHVDFFPKEFKINPENELNRLALNNNKLNLENLDEIEKTIIEFSEFSYKWQKNKTSEITKINNDSKFLYKIESLFETNFDKNVYKKVEYFYVTKNNKSIKYIIFQMQIDLFDKYINDAMIIINSFHNKENN